MEFRWLHHDLGLPVWDSASEIPRGLRPDQGSPETSRTHRYGFLAGARGRRELFTIEHHGALEARMKIRASRKNAGKEPFGRQFVLAALGTATLAACNFPLVAMGNPVARPATAPPAASQLPPISTIAKPESYKSEIPIYPSQ